MTLTGKETNYYIARKNTSNNQDSILRMNSYSGLFTSVNDFDGASQYATFEEVKQLVQLQNMLSTLTGQAYEYYVVKRDTESVRLDENGDVVEEVVPEPEVPVEESAQ